MLFSSIVGSSKRLCRLSLRQYYLVAGPGIEPGPSGYEPDEVPLLHPAIFFYTKLNDVFGQSLQDMSLSGKRGPANSYHYVCPYHTLICSAYQVKIEKKEIMRYDAMVVLKCRPM